MAVSRRLRYEVLRRDGHTCRYCGGKAPDVRLTVDHVVPVALGGSDDPSNLVAACSTCNAGKSSSSPDEALVVEVDDVALKYATALRRVIEERAAKYAAEDEHLRWFDGMWICRTSSYYRGLPNPNAPRPVGWDSSVVRFLGFGLTRSFLERAVTSAVGKVGLPRNHLWRYFCGICWREVERIKHEAAEQLHPSGPKADATSVSPPWFDFAAYVTGDLFNSLVGINDDGDWGEQLTSQVHAGMEALLSAYRRAITLGQSVDDAIDSAYDSIFESDSYKAKLPETERRYKKVQDESRYYWEGRIDGA